MKTFRKWGFALMAVLMTSLVLTACDKDDDNNNDNDDLLVDYTEDIIGIWGIGDDKAVSFYDDATFLATYSEAGLFEGTYTLQQNKLVMTTLEGEILFSGTIKIFPKDVILFTNSKDNTTELGHYYEVPPFHTSLIGTWTCLEAGYAEALVINEDGSFTSTGLSGNLYWEDREGDIFYTDGKTLSMEYMENGEFEFIFGDYEVISGKMLVIDYGETGAKRTYQYCTEDLSEEVLGMWFCNDGSTLVQNGMAVQTYNENGKTFLTTGASILTENHVVKGDIDYKVIGDLMFRNAPEEAISEGVIPHQAIRLMYVPSGNALGDMMYFRVYLPINGELQESTSSWLRVKETLALEGQKYNYSSIYVTNVKGIDKEFDFGSQTLNFANMNGEVMDKMMKNILFNIDFHSADSLCYNCYFGGNLVEMRAPIVVEGNKVTVQMSKCNPIYHDVVMYAFQDADDCQLHIYMPTSSFTNFFANIATVMRGKNGELDLNDTDAVADLYQKIDNAIESINVSIVFKK